MAYNKKWVRVKYPDRLTVMTPEYFRDWMEKNSYVLFDDFTIRTDRQGRTIVAKVKAESMKDYHYFHLVHGQS